MVAAGPFPANPSSGGGSRTGGAEGAASSPEPVRVRRRPRGMWESPERAEASRSPGAPVRVRPGRRGLGADRLPDLAQRRRVRGRRAGDRDRAGERRRRAAGGPRARGLRRRPARTSSPGRCSRCWCRRRSTTPPRSATASQVDDDDVRARIDELLGRPATRTPSTASSPSRASAGTTSSRPCASSWSARGSPRPRARPRRRPRRSCGPGTRRSARASPRSPSATSPCRTRRPPPTVLAQLTADPAAYPAVAAQYPGPDDAARAEDAGPRRGARRRWPRASPPRSRTPASPSPSRRPAASSSPSSAGPVYPPFEEVRPQLEQEATAEADAAAGGELVDAVREDLGVTVNPRYGVLEEGELVAGDRRRRGHPRGGRRGRSPPMRALPGTDPVPVALVVTVSSRLPGLLEPRRLAGAVRRRPARRPARCRGHGGGAAGRRLGRRRRRPTRRRLAGDVVVLAAPRRGARRRGGRRRRAPSRPVPGCSTSSR